MRSFSRERESARIGVHEGSPRGFTLVELLVVIGIIALLISILLPALTKAKAAATNVACLSNLQQIGLAAQSYFNENKGAFPVAPSFKADGVTVSNPTGNTWFAANALSHEVDGKWPDPVWNGYENPPGSDNWVIINPLNGLLNKLFICPGRVTFPSDPEVHMTRWSYGFNNGGGGWGQKLYSSGTPGLKLTQVVSPTTKVYAMDWPGQSISGLLFNKVSCDLPYDFVLGAGANGAQISAGAIIAPYPPAYDYTESWNEFWQGRHGPKGKASTVNVLYVDGHSATVTAAEATKDYHFPTKPSPTVTATQKNSPNNMFNLILQ